MLGKIKKSSGYFHLKPRASAENASYSALPEGWQGFDPGESGDFFMSRIGAQAKSGLEHCFILTDKSLKPRIRRQLPIWIRQLKMDYPQLDFHFCSGVGV